jgi:hypothetical protein
MIFQVFFGLIRARLKVWFWYRKACFTKWYRYTFGARTILSPATTHSLKLTFSAAVCVSGIWRRRARLITTTGSCSASRTRSTPSPTSVSIKQPRATATIPPSSLMTANFSVLYVSHAHTEAAEIADILSEYGLGPQEYGPVVTSLRNNPKAWLEFMMKFELGLEKPEPRRALVSAATIALSYVAGGLVPLLPYMFVPEAGRAMAVSVAVTLAALLFFGFVKGRFTGDRPFFSAVQTTVVGALASAAAYAMARAVQSI